jgi:acetyl esterase/lipase
VRYGEHREQVVDVAGEGPTVAILHGGCWRGRFGRELAAAGAADLVRRGYRVANVEYRRLDAGGTWPEPLDDVLTAIDAVGAEAVVGHSAGGHLALLAAAARGLLAVAQAPVTDLRRAVELRACVGATERMLAAGAASPVTSPSAVPHLLVHGDADRHVPVELGREYAAATPACDYVELAGGGHMEHIDPTSDAWAVVVEWLSARLPPGTGSRTAGSPRS